MGRDDERLLGRSLIERAVQGYRTEQMMLHGMAMPTLDEDEDIHRAVHADLFGLGRLQPLIDDEGLTEIQINACDDVWLEQRDGLVVRGEPVADSDDELVEWVRSIATYSGISSRPWDPTNPQIELRLPGGHRLIGLMGASERPVVAIRLYRAGSITLEDLYGWGSFDDHLMSFLTTLVPARMNVMLSGETGAGKTTTLRALASVIPATERIITIEHFRELALAERKDRHPNSIAFEERVANAEGEGSISIAQLVRIARRLTPDRIIVGEVMGEEIIEMLEAMTQGNDGSLSTIHSRSAREVPDRIATYALRRQVNREAALSLTGSALDFVVHVSKRRLIDGEGRQRVRRFVSSVVEVGSYDGLLVPLGEIFTTAPGDVLAQSAAPVTELRADTLSEHGYNRMQWGVAV